MPRFFNGDENALKVRGEILRDFSDLLFHELQGNVFGEKAPEVLAAHLNVEAEDVREWLRGESLPSRNLIRRLQVMFRGNRYHCCRSDGEVEDGTWAEIVELVREVENIHALKDIKITRAKNHHNSQTHATHEPQKEKGDKI